uniref:Uncharacterized protein n=1 Tax=Trypanosoma congolense (strain IL3000) TaxID=1068625 RepID=G0UNX4_TRYCI|nr:conserved hypothetical protein [Trypanosoma congolense IL3000]
MTPKHSRGPKVTRACLVLSTLVGLSLLTVSGSDHIIVPMCSEVRGFAGESNHLVRIGVSAPPGDGEAIVLIVRPFSSGTEGVSERWAQINATYRLRQGVTVSSVSNDAGMVLLQDVEGGTNIDVEIRRVRPDGPVPFRFWSYHTNRPSCFIDVSPHTTFVAAIPTTVGQLVLPARIFFKAVPLPGAKSVMLRVTDVTTGDGKPERFQLMRASDMQVAATYESGKLIPWNASVLFFSFSPPISANKELQLSVSVVWSNEGVAPGGADGSNGSLPPGTSSGGASGGSSASDGDKGHSFFFFLFLLLTGVTSYMCVGAVFNYRVQGITEFP